MNKAFISFIFILLLSNVSFPQNVVKVSNLSQIDSIKSSLNGNLILVNFWASWCKPCVEELPDLIKLKNDFSEKGLSVIFISLDFPEEIESKLVPFLKSININFTTFFNGFKKPEELMDYFDKKWDGAIPATFIFDRNGKMQSKFIGSRDYNFYQKEVLKLIE